MTMTSAQHDKYLSKMDDLTDEQKAELAGVLVSDTDCRRETLLAFWQAAGENFRGEMQGRLDEDAFSNIDE